MKNPFLVRGAPSDVASREKIERDIKAFLAAGNKIIKLGTTTHPHRLKGYNK